MGKLTARDVEAARHDPAKTRPIRIFDGDRLYLQVAPGGTKSWLFRYRLRGRSREMGLGAAGWASSGVSLEGARALADQARALLRQGKDPIDERRQVHAAAGPANPPPAGGGSEAVGRPPSTNRRASPRSGSRRAGGATTRREEAGSVADAERYAGPVTNPWKELIARARQKPAAVELPQAASGGKRRDKDREVFALMSRLPDEDFNIAGGSFSPGGAKVMARVLELVIPRTRGPASRAEFLVARAAELKAQEGLSDGAAAARVLAQLPPGDDREHVEVGGKQRRKETVRLAVKRGLHRLREDEARKLNAEARSRDLEVILGDEPDRQVLYGLGRSDKSCLEEARYMYRTTAAFRPFARAFCGQTPQGRV